MPIKSLLKIMPPPARPKHVATAATWAKAEKALSTAMPKDWLEFCTQYGSGTIGRFAFIANPAHVSGRKWIEQELDFYRQEKQSAPADKQFYYEYEAFPTSDGVLPFGQTDQRQVFYFVTQGKSDRWPIVVRDADTRMWYEHELSLSKFLTALAKGEALEPFEEGWTSQEDPLVFRS